MKNKSIISLLLIIVSTGIQAQFFVEFNSGYAKGINNKKYFEKENSYTNKDYYKLDTSNYSQYNLAQGFFIEPRVGYKINNWLSASVGFYYNNNYKWNAYANNFGYENTSTTFSNDSGTTLILVDKIQYKAEFSSKTIGFTPKLTLYKKISNIEIGLSLGMLISKTIIYNNNDTLLSRNFIDATEDGYYYNLESGYRSITQETNSRSTLSSNYIVTLLYGVNFIYHINNNFSFGLEVNYCNLIIEPDKKTTFYSFYEKKDKSYGGSSNIITEEDTTETVSETNGNVYGMNNLQFTFGIRYTFGKKEKIEK